MVRTREVNYEASGRRLLGAALCGLALLGMAIYAIYHATQAGKREVCEIYGGGDPGAIFGYEPTRAVEDCGGPSWIVYAVLAVVAVVGLVIAAVPAPSQPVTTARSAPPTARGPVAGSLRTLEILRTAGEVTEEQYQAERKRLHDSVAGRLRTLKILRDSGEVTEEQYLAERRRLIGDDTRLD